MKRFIPCLGSVLMMVLCFGAVLYAAEEGKKPVEVVIMTTPFGTPMYNEGAAYEQVFKKAGSWVHMKHQETPGAFYMYTYIPKNRDKMIAGEISQTVATSASTAIRFVAEGRPPFQKSWPTTRGLVSSVGYVFFFLTFDPEIKSLGDLVGKRVGTATAARIFTGRLFDKPLFGKGLGIYDKIKWAELGAAGSKDAILDGKLDATKLWFAGRLEVGEDGSLYAPAIAPSPPTMELLSSGRKYHFLPIEAEWIKKGFDYSKDQEVLPALVKKGAMKGLDQDIPALVGPGVIQCDSSLPDDVVEEIVRVRHEYRKEFAKYHAQLAFLPTTPYPLGTPKEYVHPGVIKAMKKLGIPIPKN